MHGHPLAAGIRVVMAHVQSVLGERYELHEVLGRGAMGTVYRATDRVLARDVAVKVLALDRADDPTFVARFEREALAVAALSDPRIVAVYDSGHDDGTHFIVMEHVHGASLARLVREGGPMPVEHAVAVATDFAGALAVAHRAGIVHRDVKPANAMLDEDGSLKVLDFGIAKAAASVSLTQTATVLGSAPYLAPEAIRGDRADERSDIYSLGCVLYELLTGRPPFTGELPAAILRQHETVTPPPPRDLRPGIPAAVDAVVLGMLAKEPASRPQSAQALQRSLPASLNAHPRAADTGSVGVAGTEPTRVLGRGRRRVIPAEAAALGVAIVILAMGLVLTFVGFSSPSHRRRAAATTVAHRPARRTTPITTQPAAKAPQTESTPTSPPVDHAVRPPAVATAAGMLTTIVTDDAQSGRLDRQAAQQTLGDLSGVLNAYDAGDPNALSGQLRNLSTHVEQLAAHGDIQAAAVPAITAGVNELAEALARTGPPAAASPGPAGAGPEGSGPPGHLKDSKPHGPGPHGDAQAPGPD
jgi:tRNA A-37 threonylcarbamoyl transferase component Bud32